MSNVTAFIGLDYHKDSIQLCVVNSRGDVLGNRRVADDVVAVTGYAGRFGQVDRVAIESCPEASDSAEELVQNGWHVDLAHKWPSRHKRFHIHFAPTSSSWLNVIERWLRDPTEQRIRRGVFRNVTNLIDAIMACIAAHNENPATFQ